MVDFQKALDKTLEKKRAAARKKPEVVEGHKWYRLINVVDNLNLVLRKIYESTNGKVFEYEYTDKKSDLGHDSTKYGTLLPMPEMQLEREIEKNIFKVIIES